MGLAIRWIAGLVTAQLLVWSGPVGAVLVETGWNCDGSASPAGKTVLGWSCEGSWDGETTIHDVAQMLIDRDSDFDHGLWKISDQAASSGTLHFDPLGTGHGQYSVEFVLKAGDAVALYYLYSHDKITQLEYDTLGLGWRTPDGAWHYGQEVEWAYAFATVPEPATDVLFGLGVCCFLVGSRFLRRG